MHTILKLLNENLITKHEAELMLKNNQAGAPYNILAIDFYTGKYRFV